MKTCKDCIYYVTYLEDRGEYGRTSMHRVHTCRLNPIAAEVDGKGCGQLKEKVTELEELLK